jgi:hypothetical protein
MGCIGWINEKCIQNLVGKPEGNIAFERPGHRGEDNIQMDLKEAGYEGVDLIEMSLGRVQWRNYVKRVTNIRDP